MTETEGWEPIRRPRRRMGVILSVRRGLVLLLFVLFLMPIAARPAWACSCATDFDPLERADLAFVGTVEDVDGGWTGSEVEVEFAVESVVKGDAGRAVTLVTAEDGASCGYDFVAGGRYRVYARDGATSLCDGNELLAAGSGRDDGNRPVWVGAVLVLLMAGGVTWLVRRARRRP